MRYDWGPHYIVPSPALKSYSGIVQLREEFDAGLLQKELEELGFPGPIVRISNPWYYRPKGTRTWIKAGESQNQSDGFAVSWNTRDLKNGQYEIMGLMHVSVKHGGAEKVIAGENIVEVSLKN
jgi:hypothetical protein